MISKEFDDGKQVIFQERLKGKEVSLICISDGRTIVPLLPAQDYKRLKDGDKGPNTGGMGGFAPTPALTKELFEEVYQTILRPTIDGMRNEGNLFQGVLYVGLMLTQDGPKVLEYNVRFGDPETQLLVMLLKSDLLPLLKASTNGTLTQNHLIFNNGVVVCRVLASRHYPYAYDKGKKIHGLNKFRDPDVQVFHAGTIFENGHVRTNGGRVLTVTALGKNFPDAIGKLDRSIGKEEIHFKGMQVREDIAKNI